MIDYMVIFLHIQFIPIYNKISATNQPSCLNSYNIYKEDKDSSIQGFTAKTVTFGDENTGLSQADIAGLYPPNVCSAGP